VPPRTQRTAPAPLEVDRDLLARVARRISAAGGSAEIFLEGREQAAARFEEGGLLDPSCGATLGAGLRVLQDERTARFLHLDGLSEDRLLLAAGRLAEGGPAPQGGPPTGRRVRAEGEPAALLPGGLDAAFSRIERGARDAHPAVAAVRIDYDAWCQRVLIYREEILVEDCRRAVQVRVRATACSGGRREEGVAVVGCAEPADLLSSLSLHEIGRRAGEAAAIRLEAGPSPSGEMPVVFASRCGAALFHEALGHALEADFLLRGESPYAGLAGQPVASPLITVVDDPTLPGRRGSYRVDDEGTPAGRTVLLKEGVLRGFLTDRATARRSGLPATGNGRRGSYRDLPLPRMSNLCVEGWKDDPDDILAATREGLYVVELGGARVRFPEGEFAFEVAEAFRIEDGRLARPVEGAVLVGRGPEALRRIDRVGADFLLDPGAGSCDKDGQRVPVSLGQPSLRVSRLAVRGTSR
jgi:TldD protein